MTEELRRQTLITFFFGNSSNYKLLGVNRAYRDFNRTLYLENEKSSDRVQIKTKTAEFIVEKLSYILDHKFSNQDEFDKFHKTVCEEIKEFWGKLHFGQIQKWVNMTLKYWLIIGNIHIPNIGTNSKWFHIPIDNLVLQTIIKERTQKTAWSRMDYKTYFSFQLRFRELYPNEIPIIKETEIFNNLLKK